MVFCQKVPMAALKSVRHESAIPENQMARSWRAVGGGCPGRLTSLGGREGKSRVDPGLKLAGRWAADGNRDKMLIGGPMTLHRRGDQGLGPFLAGPLVRRDRWHGERSR